MDWYRPIWVMCERTGRGLLEEPANLLSSFAFLAVAAAALVAWRRRGGRDPAALVLIALTAVIALGSSLFHAYAELWALYADLVPIQVFVGIYFFVAMRRLIGLPMVVAAALTAVFVVAARAYVESVPWSFLRGYGRLFAGLVPLFAIAVFVRLRAGEAAGGPGLVGPAAREAGDLLLAASLGMGAAIACGASDRALCSASPIGTHSLWHLLIAAVIGILLHVAIAAGPERAAAGGLRAAAPETQ